MFDALEGSMNMMLLSLTEYEAKANHLSLSGLLHPPLLQAERVVPLHPSAPPLPYRKLSNPDLSPAAATASSSRSKLQRQLSQDESWSRRSSLAMTGSPARVPPHPALIGCST